MIVFGLFGPILCVVVPLVAVVIAMIIYVVAHYCISEPLSRHSQQEVGAAGMMMKMASNEGATEDVDNREGNFNCSCYFASILLHCAKSHLSLLYILV